MSASSDPGPLFDTQELVRIFLCGDVMTGRGIDQILPFPCDPQIHERYMQSAEGYVQLAERANGVIPRAVTLSYIWGAALEELDRFRPDVRIVNLETSITRGGRFAPKGINYRMSPKNAACLTAADLDCCVLANNHILDFDKTGLLDSLEILERLKVKFVGAGRNRTQADLPAVLDIQGGGRVLVFAVGAYSSGIPPSWSATDTAPGVRFIKDLSDETAAEIADDIIRQRKSGDLAILSVHWGSNWGFEIPDAHRRFAHRLIDSAPVSIVHGHSSHHPIAVEVYRNRLILYGCGDLLNDYEGIAGHEQFLNSLSLMYFVTVQRATGDLAEVVIVPLRIRRFQLVHASRQDVDLLSKTLDRECRRLGAGIVPKPDGRFRLSWDRSRTARSNS